jgi:hypothetical protein
MSGGIICPVVIPFSSACLLQKSSSMQNLSWRQANGNQSADYAQ